MYISVGNGHFRVMAQARPIITQKDRQRYGAASSLKARSSRELVSTAIPLGFTFARHAILTGAPFGGEAAQTGRKIGLRSRK
jgi:hypothetical protein